MPPITPPPSDRSTSESLRELPMLVEWHQCPRHPWLGVSVLVSPDCLPLCIGPETTHYAERVTA